MSQSQLSHSLQQAIGVAVQRHNEGHLSQAETIYRQVLRVNPNHPVALHLLGVIANQTEKNGLAVDLITKALTVKPDFAEAHSNLGVALRELGRLKEAVDSCHKALALRPNFAEAYNNLGLALKDLGKLEEAADCYQKALTIQPDFANALGNYGSLCLASNLRRKAFSFFHKQLEVVRGRTPINPDHESFRFISKAKMKHDIEQFQYLGKFNYQAERFNRLVQDYSELDQEIKWPDNDSEVVPLTNEQRERIKDTYNRPFHLHSAPEIAGSALNQDLNTELITQSYMDNAPGMAYFDSFLNETALNSLQRFLMESTIWYSFRYSAGYLGSMLTDGMACPLLLQIADELRQTFPEIFKQYPLNQMWAYKYDNRPAGIGIHADGAAINVNFWITPDSANLNSCNGGLVVHKKEAPLDWEFSIYNREHEKIRRFLEEHDTGVMVVPYAENRVVLFNSNLFHETDQLEFKPGYENRRINVTMLFGNRWDDK